MQLDHHLARMSEPRTRVLTGHDPSLDIPGHEGQGIDMLLTEFLDAAGQVTRRELATRPGHRQTWLTWGVPIVLEVAA